MGFPPYDETTTMPVPYLTKKMTRKIAKQNGHRTNGNVAVTFCGFVLYYLPIEAVSLTK